MLTSLLDFLGAVAPIALAVAAVAYFDRRMVRAGLLPPAFSGTESGAGPTSLELPRLRRIASLVLLGMVFWVGVFLPLASLGGPEPDLSRIGRIELFFLHFILLLTITAWYFLGFGGRPRSRRQGFGSQFGLRSPAIWKDLGIGLAAGVGAWVAVLLILILLGTLIWALGGEDALPQQPPSLVSWIAALPIGLRLALSASAGFAEEIFFRGFLQARAGIAFSTVLFVVAHVGYGQPLMLVGVSLLSLVFAALVRWRQNIWAAVMAHAVFDALQLTVVIPKALEFLDGSSGLPV